jgi:hypothetical protein
MMGGGTADDGGREGEGKVGMGWLIWKVEVQPAQT